MYVDAYKQQRCLLHDRTLRLSSDDAMHILLDGLIQERLVLLACLACLAGARKGYIPPRWPITKPV